MVKQNRGQLHEAQAEQDPGRARPRRMWVSLVGSRQMWGQALKAQVEQDPGHARPGNQLQEAEGGAVGEYEGS